ncbi:MAG TPA: hypothetical protein VII93_14465 [Anaerolineales bacterium]
MNIYIDRDPVSSYNTRMEYVCLNPAELLPYQRESFCPDREPVPALAS